MSLEEFTLYSEEFERKLQDVEASVMQFAKSYQEIMKLGFFMEENFREYLTEESVALIQSRIDALNVLLAESMKEQ